MKVHINADIRRGVKKILSISILLIFLASLVTRPASTQSSGEPLRDLAEMISRGPDGEHLLFGAAGDGVSKANEFNFWTAENSMKMDRLQGSEGNFNWGADSMVNSALNSGMKVHGHVLVWHSQAPGWLNSKSRDGLISAMYNHIDTVLGHYRGKIAVWDVVNEALSPHAGSYRSPSVWYDKIGADFIPMAFKRARDKADEYGDTDLKLIYNDFNLATNDAKFDFALEMVKDMLAKYPDRRIIDGIGFQMHVGGDPRSGSIDKVFDEDVRDGFIEKLQRIADLGLEAYITELDVRFNTSSGGITQEQMATQAKIYKWIVEACVAQPACKGIQVWGVTDSSSWITKDNSTFGGEADPLLFNNSGQPKPAYYAVQEALQNGVKGADAYVKQGGSGTKDCSSWENACPTLQDALAKVSSGVIWVAKGTYYPDEGSGQTPNSPASTFRLKNGVEIYGGFAGNGSARDVKTNITVLSGDLGQDDTRDSNNIVQKPPQPVYKGPGKPLDMTSDIKGTNAYHVVTASGVNETAILDGFTITAGYAESGSGGGMLNDNASPKLSNLSFYGNWGEHGGGMANINNGSPTLLAVTFSGNSAKSGGGMYNIESIAFIDSTTFTGNWAWFGGAIMNLHVGGDYVNNDYTHLYVRSSTISGNTTRPHSADSGAVHDDTSLTVYVNSTMWGNNFSMRTIYSEHSMTNVSSSNVEGCQYSSDSGPVDWNIYKDRGKFTNTKVDPGHRNALAADLAPTTGGDYRLLKASPLIDAGNSLSVTVSIDRDNNFRIIDGKVDVGAYEYFEEISLVEDFYVYLPTLYNSSLVLTDTLGVTTDDNLLLWRNGE